MISKESTWIFFEVAGGECNLPAPFMVCVRIFFSDRHFSLHFTKSDHLTFKTHRNSDRLEETDCWGDRLKIRTDDISYRLL